MNTYQHRWRLAVALKHPYPAPDTGAEDSTTSTAAPPPVFVPVSNDWSPEKKIMVVIASATAGAVAGIFLMDDLSRGVRR